MSKLEVDKIDPQSGTDLELGSSGDTITIPSGATLDASNATTTLPANVVTTDGTQTLTNKTIDASQLTGTITPSDGTVTNAKVNASAAIDYSKLNLTGNIALADLSATGTKDATTFLRGDNTFVEAGGGIFESQLLHVRDIKIYATDGGSSVVGSQTRDLNTVETNEISGASLSSNQITLPAGTYFIMASAPAYKPGNSKAVLHNVTRNAVDAVGTVEYSDVSDNVLVRSFINKRFTITVTSVFEIRHFIGAAKATNGLGIGYNVASTNIYTEVMIWKVA